MSQRSLQKRIRAFSLIGSAALTGCALSVSPLQPPTLDGSSVVDVRDANPAIDIVDVIPSMDVVDAGEGMDARDTIDTVDVTVPVDVLDVVDSEPPRDAGRDTGLPDVIGGCDPCPTTLRLIAPSSLVRVSQRTPEFRWASDVPLRNGVLEVSRTRDFASVVASATVNGSSHRFMTPLPSGVLYWRVRAGSLQSATWELFVPTTDARGMSESLPVYDVDGDGSSEISMLIPIRAMGTQWVINTVGVRNDAFVSHTVSFALNVTTPNTVGMLTNAGDINGDGVGESLLVWNTRGLARAEYLLFQRGIASVVGVPLSQPLQAEEYARDIQGVGDINRDGYADVVLLTSRDSLSPAATHLYMLLGGPSELRVVGGFDLRTLTPGEAMRPSVAGVGDVDGDGYGDVALTLNSVSQPRQSRSVQTWIFYGNAMGVLSESRVWTAPPQFSGAVVFPYALGDINGDGRAEVGLSHVGFVGTTPSPRAEPTIVMVGVLRTATVPVWIRMQALPMDPTRLDSTMTALGDINNDGLGDFAAGEGGVTRIYLGNSASSQLASVRTIDRRVMRVMTNAYQSVLLAWQVTPTNVARLLTIDWGDDGAQTAWLSVFRDDALTGTPLPLAPNLPGVTMQTRFGGELQLAQ